jgi:hypothetical protein
MTAAYWFTAATSFANPAVTTARARDTISREREVAYTHLGVQITANTACSSGWITALGEIVGILKASWGSCADMVNRHIGALLAS